MSRANITDILSEAEKLDKEGQLRLLKGLYSLIHKKTATGLPVKLSSISGLGSNIWSNINIDDYLDKERQW